MSDLVLSLFPGIGLFDLAFESEGYCVVRGPDLLWGGDIRQFSPPRGVFRGIIGGPPCTPFSQLTRNIVAPRGQKVAEDLIPEFERVVTQAQPDWFVMENVEDAPEPAVWAYHIESVVVNNRWFGGIQNRVRRFSFGLRSRVLPAKAFDRAIAEQMVTLEPSEYAPTVTASGTIWKGGRAYGDHSARYLAHAIRAQELPDDFALPGFTVREAIRAVGNGVPLPLGRAIARAVRRATTEEVSA